MFLTSISDRRVRFNFELEIRQWTILAVGNRLPSFRPGRSPGEHNNSSLRPRVTTECDAFPGTVSAKPLLNHVFHRYTYLISFIVVITLSTIGNLVEETTRFRYNIFTHRTLHIRLRGLVSANRILTITQYPSDPAYGTRILGTGND